MLMRLSLIRRSESTLQMGKQTITEKASLAGKHTVIPGLAYKLVKPFLGMEITSKAWKMLNKRN